MSTTDAEKKPADTFYVLMQKGLTGGPPTPAPLERFLITRATKSDNFIVDLKVRSTENVLKMDPTINRLLKVADYEKSIIRLQELMEEIPTQYCGVEDLYGRDTSIVLVTDPMRSWDLHLSGKNAPKDIPHPTEEHKKMFDEAVGIIENWGRRGGPIEMYQKRSTTS